MSLPRSPRVDISPPRMNAYLYMKHEKVMTKRYMRKFDLKKVGQIARRTFVVFMVPKLVTQVESDLG